MAGPNYVLDKGFITDSLVNFGEFVILTANTHVTKQTVAAQTVLHGVAQFSIVDATKLATGKVQLDVRLMGISRVIADVAIARGAKVAVNAAGHATVAGVAGTAVVGYAMTPAVNVGDFIDLLLTPGCVA